MPITTDNWSYRYQEMKTKLEQELRYEEETSQIWRIHYLDLYRSHATQNKLLLDQYGLEGEADARDIIMRQEAALMNMRERNENLLLRNRGLEEDVQQLEEWIDDGGPRHDDMRQDDGL